MIYIKNNSRTCLKTGCGKHTVQTQATNSDITNSGFAFEVEKLLPNEACGKHKHTFVYGPPNNCWWEPPKTFFHFILKHRAKEMCAHSRGSQGGCTCSHQSHQPSWADGPSLASVGPLCGWVCGHSNDQCKADPGSWLSPAVILKECKASRGGSHKTRSRCQVLGIGVEKNVFYYHGTNTRKKQISPTIWKKKKSNKISMIITSMRVT